MQGWVLFVNLLAPIGVESRFMKMLVEYKKEIGFGGPLFIEPKPQEPTKHQVLRIEKSLSIFL